MDELELRRRLESALGPPPPTGPALARARLHLHVAAPAAAPRLLPLIAAGLALAVVVSMLFGLRGLAPIPARVPQSHPAGRQAPATPGQSAASPLPLGSPTVPASQAAVADPSAGGPPPACRLGLTLFLDGRTTGYGYMHVDSRTFESVPAQTYLNAVAPAVPGQTVRVSPWNVSPDRRFGAYTQGNSVYLLDISTGQSRQLWTGPGIIQVLSYQPEAVYFSQIQTTGGNALWAANPDSGATRPVTRESAGGWYNFKGGFAWQAMAADGGWLNRTMVKRLDLASGQTEIWYQGSLTGINVIGAFAADTAVVGLPATQTDAKGPTSYSRLLLLTAPGRTTQLAATELARFHATGLSQSDGQTLWVGATDGVWAISRTAGLSRVGDVAGAPPAFVYVDTTCR